MLEDQIVRRIGHRADLLDDDVLLARQFHAVESGLGQNVGEHVERQRHVVLEHARIVGGAFGAGRGVQIAADRLDLLGDLTGRAPPRALERHMLEEMRNAVLVMKFVAAAGSDPYAERCRLKCGMASVTTLMPEFRVVTSTLMLPLLPGPHGSSQGRNARPQLDQPAAR